MITAMTGCKKDSAASGYMNTILISGPNMTVPPCAPAFNATWSDGANAGAAVTLSNTASTIGLNNTSYTYPVSMRINWIAHTPSCSGQITVTSYQVL